MDIELLADKHDKLSKVEKLKDYLECKIRSCHTILMDENNQNYMELNDLISIHNDLKKYKDLIDECNNYLKSNRI